MRLAHAGDATGLILPRFGQRATTARDSVRNGCRALPVGRRILREPALDTSRVLGSELRESTRYAVMDVPGA
jgi:hypothetical protein